MTPDATPPRAALWLLDRLLSKAAAEAITGDLAEDFARLARRRGPRAARRWFWQQTLASITARGRAPASRLDHSIRGHFRQAGPMDHVMQDLRFGLRVLAKAPGFTVTAVLTLAIAIGGATTIATAAGWVWLRPLPYPAPDQLVQVGEPSRSNAGIGNVGYQTLLDWRASADAFQQVVPIRSWSPTLQTADGAVRLDALRVGWQFFGLLGARPALGRDFTADDDRADRRVVVISDRIWQQRFEGRSDVIGRPLSLNGQDFEVVGVLPATFEPLISGHFYAAADVWAPLGYPPDGPSSCRTCRHLRALGRLKPDQTVESATSQLAVVHERLREAFPDEYGEAPPIVARLKTQMTGQFARPFQVLMGAVAILLLIACANVASLLIARATAREQEIAVRAALGAGRLRIARQLLAESVILAGVATAVGMAVARIALVVLAGAAPAGLPRLDRASSDPTMWLIATAVGTVTLLLFGLLPSLEAARTDLQAVLRASRQTAGRRHVGLREAMVAGQIAIALVLAVGGGLMFRTVDRLLGVNPGFSPEGVLTAQFSLVGARWAEDAAVYGFQQEIADRVSRLPGVEAVGVTGLLPLGGSFDRRGFGIEGQTYATTDDVPSAERYSVTPGYFAAMKIGLRVGRLIDERDTRESELVVLVNETAVRRFWEGENPVGAGLTFGTSADSPRVTVVGVVADVRHYDLETPPIPQIYRPQSQSTDSFLTLTVRAPGRLDGLGDQIRREVATLAPDVPVYGVVPLEQRLEASIGTRAFLMTLLMWFAGVSVALSAVGLYGIVSQTVRGREREIGIRVSLGARRLEVARLVLGRGLALIGAGLVVGLAASALAARFLETQLFETAVLDPATYATAAAGLLAAGLLAHILPLRRAIGVNPNLILRGD